MKKDFRSYLLKHERSHFYRVKTIAPIGDFGATEEARHKACTALSMIENALQKFDPISIERVKKTILQRVPLDFTNVSNKEVYILDLELGMPVSPVELQHLITMILDTPPNYVMVYGEADPREMEEQTIAAVKDIEQEAVDTGFKPASLLTDCEEHEADDVEAIKYGDRYNARLLAYFNAARDHKNEEEANFNADVEGAISAHPHVEPGEEIEIKTIRRTYRDESGKLHTLTRKIDRFGSVPEND